MEVCMALLYCVLGSAVGTVLLVFPCEKLLKWLDRQVLHG